MFHFARGSQHSCRHLAEFNFKQDATDEVTGGEARVHSSFAYSYFVFNVLKSFDLTEYSKVQSNVSAAAVYRDAQGFAQLDLTHLTPNLFTLGLGYKLCNKFSLYAQGSQALQKAEKEETLAKPTVSLGVDYAHCSGFGVKGAIDLKGKLQTAFNFNANKYFSGSLLFDVSWCNDRPTFASARRAKREILLGEQRLSSTAKNLIHVFPRFWKNNRNV